MDKAENNNSQQLLLEIITEFIRQTSGLRIENATAEKVEILQLSDSHKMYFHTRDLSDVLTREDRDGKTFIQVNFHGGKKILLTETLIGFKPEPNAGLDLRRLPKVVTTPDLLSVFEAVEEVLNSDQTNQEEVDILKKVYFSILDGAETVGFDLSEERNWLSRLLITPKASA